MKIIKGKLVNAMDIAFPLPTEESDIKLLYHIDPATGNSIGDVCGFMCKRCGSEWEITQPRVHEIYCVHH